jgi:hypothetical protein
MGVKKHTVRPAGKTANTIYYLFIFSDDEPFTLDPP